MFSNNSKRSLQILIHRVKFEVDNLFAIIVEFENN